MQYSLDLRERVVSYVRNCKSIEEAFKLFDVSRAAI
ncbi:MAG: IS630 transposase-related protein [Cyanobacteria bacterium P01_E01_bin.34]